jgi:hypothetical protein
MKSFHTIEKLFASTLILTLVSIPIFAQTPQEKPNPPVTNTTIPQLADAKDVSSLDNILAAVYDVISGPAGKKRDWNRMRSLFIPGARLIPTSTKPNGESVTRVLEVEDYIKTSGEFLEKNGFFEKEVNRQTESFGHIVHVFSTYEARQKAEDEKPFIRGINSIQLMNDGKRWWIVTILWEAEKPDNPIPMKYLPK